MSSMKLLKPTLTYIQANIKKIKTGKHYITKREIYVKLAKHI